MNLAINELCALPLFKALLPVLKKFQHQKDLPSIAELNQQLCLEGITLVPQSPKSTDFSAGYEPRIYLKGEVQTREQSWHDFFNALVWQQFPQSKKIINQLQYQLQKQRYPDKQRLPAENMLTLFDENGAVVVSQNPELLDLIKRHRWHELFWQRREEVKQQLQVFIFGHGLYEKSLQPYIGITAQSLLFFGEKLNSVDELTAKFITEIGVSVESSMLNPLPILGVPGWWSENENEIFYTNKSYFRDKS